MYPKEKKILTNSIGCEYINYDGGKSVGFNDCHKQFTKEIKKRAEVERLAVVIDKELETNTTWRHIEFPNDFPYDRVITKVRKDIAKVISKEFTRGLE